MYESATILPFSRAQRNSPREWVLNDEPSRAPVPPVDEPALM
jgi:hypothetical protein